MLKNATEYPFHKAVYYAAITVIGRPGVPIETAATAVFITGLGMTAVRRPANCVVSLRVPIR